MSKPIDKVTTEFLDLGLRLMGISLPLDVIDKIIDMVELLENKGGNTDLKDIVKLENEWKIYEELKSVKVKGTV